MYIENLTKKDIRELYQEGFEFNYVPKPRCKGMRCEYDPSTSEGIMYEKAPAYTDVSRLFLLLAAREDMKDELENVPSGELERAATDTLMKSKGIIDYVNAFFKGS